MSVNHKLYIKITNSKDMHKTIEIEEKKLIKKLKASNKILRKEGFSTFKFYLLFSQYTTLGELKKNPKLSYNKVVNTGALWFKHYFKFLTNKYKNKNKKNNEEIALIIKKDGK